MEGFRNWFFGKFKTTEENKSYTETRESFCDKKDCVRFNLLLIGREKESFHLRVYWGKRENKYVIPSVAGPVPCIYCKYFKGADFYTIKG